MLSSVLLGLIAVGKRGEHGMAVSEGARAHLLARDAVTVGITVQRQNVAK